MTRRKSRDVVDQLEDPEQWDWEHAEVHLPVKSPRVVLSVAFPSQHFEIVARCAEQMGKKLSEFVREAALERVAREYGWASFTLPSVAGAGAFITAVEVRYNTHASGYGSSEVELRGTLRPK